MSLRAFYREPVKRQLLFSGFWAFIFIGITQAMYGPAFPLFRAKYGVSDAQLGLIVSLHFIGAFIAILLAGFLIGRFGYRLVLLSSTVLTIIGSLGVAFSPAWLLSLMAAFILGLGFGGIDIGMNILFGQGFGARGAAALNLLNAMFGLGAVIGPLLVAVFLPVGLSWPFVVSALAATLLLFLLGRTEMPTGRQPSSSGGGGALLLSLFGFIVLYFVYVGSEAGAGSWIATHLAPSYGEAKAASFTALFWGALMVGRFLAVPLTIYLKSSRLVIFTAVLAVTAFALAHILSLAPYAYALAGLFLAPIFPTGLAWLQEVFPDRAARATSLAVAFASLGGVVFPSLIGVLVATSSSAIIPTALMTLTLLCALVAALLRFISRGRGAS